MYDRIVEALHEKVKRICYAFYRYEIKDGLKQVELFTKEMSSLLTHKSVSEAQHRELNKLLELILLAVENRDYLIAADILMYELFGRIKAVAGSSE
ncbi:hypothetical protein [Paenibacillus sp. SI8]|uniref:hypothetical protein n=1 Tax=unclassified Paenibacillus TaxID=185978 RepID=UPI003465451C